MTRPRISDSDRRVVQVNIRLTSEEDQKVNTYASSSGLSPANWIRYKIFKDRFPQAKMSSIETSVYQELKKIGVNLNQIAHRVNQGQLPNELAHAHNELMDILNKLLNILTDDRHTDQG